MADEFYNFDEALDQLNLKEEELKRLVSEGEIRAFRDGERMKLRRMDVESLKTELMGGDVVDLGGASEELVFEDDLELEETGMATEEISDMDTLLEEDVEDVGELELEDEEEYEEEDEAPVVRRAAAVEEPDPEGPFMRLIAIATAAVMILAIPILTSLMSGNSSDLASSIAGMFGGGAG